MIENLKVLKTTELNEQAKIQVLDLWNNEYPVKLSYSNLSDFESYLRNLSNPQHYLLANDRGLILGWAFTFDREDERWFAIILSETIKGSGIGRKILEEIRCDEPILNGWVIDHNNDKKQNGQYYISPLKFYVKCGFEVIDDTRLEIDKLSAIKIKWMKSNRKENSKF